MNPGFAVLVEDDRVEFRSLGSPQSGRSPVTFFEAVDGCAVLMGQFRSHDPQRDAVSDPDVEGSSPGRETNPAAFAFLTLGKQGLDGLEHLQGDFSLVVWDAPANRLIGIRDPMGGYPLFWTKLANGIALSTSLYELLASIPTRCPDLEYAAEYLITPGPVNEIGAEITAYRDIRRILPGTRVVFDLSSGHVQRHRYWNWLDRIIEPQSNRRDEASFQYGECLRRAVQARIRGKTVSHLSGGMDSTAVSLIAAELIASGTGTPPLHTISLVYQRLSALSRETPYILSALQQNESIVAHSLPADDLLDFECFAGPPPHEEPFVGLPRLTLDRAVVDHAADLGAETMLTGIGADELMDVQPFYISDILRKGRLLKGWQEAVRWAAADNCSPWEVFFFFGLANVCPHRRRGGIIPWTGHAPNPLTDCSMGAVPPWIRPRFARRHCLEDRIAENLRKVYRSCDSTALSVALSSLASRAGDVDRWYLASSRGLTIAHPFLDIHLLRLGLGIVARFSPEPGMMKPVLAEAMRDVLPDKIRNRRRKAAFNEVYFLGLSKNLHLLESMIERTCIEDLDIVDKGVLTRYLRLASLGGVSARISHRLNLMLTFIKWLSMQEQWTRIASLQATPLTSRRLCRGWGSAPATGAILSSGGMPIQPAG